MDGSPSPLTTALSHLKRDRPVTLTELNEVIITNHVNDWTHERCYTVIENSPMVEIGEIGAYDTVPDCIRTESGTTFEARVRYHAAIAIVEDAINDCDDPVEQFDLRLHA